MALVANKGKEAKGKESKGKEERMAKECISPKSSKASGPTCVFCCNGADEELCGKMFTKGGVAVHYFCMLFSSGLCQNGKSEKQGILGFLQQDILKEVKRGGRLRCTYCKKIGATIGCVVRNCKKMFHLGCGRTNGTMHQFFGTFCSYCPDHRAQQDIPSSDDPNIVCSICMNTVKASPSDVTLRAPCCSKYWYHRDCVQAYAMSAGLHFFKCPLCNNKDEFQDEMLTMGIYIPDQDASWEKEPNAFQELLERYGQCDAPDCKCPKGRTFNKEDSKRWELLLCDFCGSHGSHKTCNHLIKHGKHKICQDCFEVDKKYHAEGLKNGKGKSKSPCSKRKSLEALQLMLNSPNSSKGTSSYPGPSSAMKKKGLPQTGGKKKKSKENLSKRMMERSPSPYASKKQKRRKTATVTYDELNSDDNEENFVKLRQPLPASVNRASKSKKGSRKSESWIGGSQSILRDWLQSESRKSNMSKIKKAAPVTPRKKKPMVVEWEGKELLIKSPRVVLHRKHVFTGKSTDLKKLVIDMSDGKLGSDWDKEMELLANIDTNKRVTRNMIDIDAAKSVFDKTNYCNRKLTLHDVSPKKQYVPLYPDLRPDSSNPTSGFPSDTFDVDNLDKSLSELKKGSPAKSSDKSRYELKKGSPAKSSSRKLRHEKIGHRIRKRTERKYDERATSINKDMLSVETTENSDVDVEQLDDDAGGIDVVGSDVIFKNPVSLVPSANAIPSGSEATLSPVSLKSPVSRKLDMSKSLTNTCVTHSNTDTSSPVFNSTVKRKMLCIEDSAEAEQALVSKSDNGNSDSKKQNSRFFSLFKQESPSKITRRSLSAYLQDATKQMTRRSLTANLPDAKKQITRRSLTSNLQDAKKQSDKDGVQSLNSQERPIFPNKETQHLLKAKLLNYSPKVGRSARNHSTELDDSPAKNLRPRQLADNGIDSPSKNLRPRQVADSGIENTGTEDKADDTDFDKISENVNKASSLMKALRNYNFHYDQNHPNLKTKTNKHLNTVSNGNEVSFQTAVENKSGNPNTGNPDRELCTSTSSLEIGSKSSGKTHVDLFWHLDGTEQIGLSSTTSISKSKYTKLCPSTPQSGIKQPVSEASSTPDSSSQGKSFNSSSRSSPRKTVADSEPVVVDRLSDLQNIIPAYNIEMDSPEDLCDTAKNLSPSYFTKFRSALSRSESFDSMTTTSMLGKDLPLTMQRVESPAITGKYFLSRHNILNGVIEHSDNYVKQRSSPRRSLHKGSNKPLDFDDDDITILPEYPSMFHDNNTDKPAEHANDRSIMSEYYK